MKYKAYIVEDNNGAFNGSIKELEVPKLEEGKVLIKVINSSLNYIFARLQKHRYISRNPSSASSQTSCRPILLIYTEGSNTALSSRIQKH